VAIKNDRPLLKNLWDYEFVIILFFCFGNLIDKFLSAFFKLFYIYLL